MDLPPDPAASRWTRFRRSGGLSGRIHDAFRRRLTTSGKSLFGLWFVALVVSRIASRSLADLPFALFSAALAVSWGLSWRRVRLEGSWKLPDDLEQGGRAEVEVVLSNPGSSPVHDAGAGFFRFADGVDFPGDGRHHARLAPGERVVLRIPVSGRLRGPARIDPPHLLGAEPLGLMRGSTRLEGGATIVVKPRRFQVGGFGFLVRGPDGPSFARELGGQPTRQGDPSGVREYRPGDSLRDLHHRSWARRGRPVTRERTASRGDGIRLVVSTWCSGAGDRPLLDPMLSLAASLAAWIERNGGLGETWIDGVRIDPGVSGLADRFWIACGEVPRAGWPRRAPSPPPDPPGGGELPLLYLGLSGDPFGEAGRRGTKRILLDWDAAEDAEPLEDGRLLRVPPEAIGPGIRL